MPHSAVAAVEARPGKDRRSAPL